MWYTPYNDHGYGKMGFFCNTADVSFGPVVYVDYSYDVKTVLDVIYKHWDDACREVVFVPTDARSVDDDEKLRAIAKRCLILGDLEDEEGDA